MVENQISSLSSSFEHFIYLLEEMKSKRLNDGHLSETVANLQAENLKLKEANICLEKKVAEQQNKLERLALKCQSSANSEQEFCTTREELLESSSKMLEEENTKLSQTIAELQVQLLHANEKNCLDQEEWQYHRQKMEKLLDFVGQLLEKVGWMEGQMHQLEQATDRVMPTVTTFVRRCASLQLAYSHSECRIGELVAKLDEARESGVAKETQLASLEARLQALQAESDSREADAHQMAEESMTASKRCVELQQKMTKLETELLETQQVVKEQSELLAQKFSPAAAGESNSS